MNRTPLTATEIPTPFGTLAVFTAADGVVHASGFGTAARVADRFPRHLHGTAWAPGENPRVVAAINRWLAGDPGALASVAVAQTGGPFTAKVWEAMAQIPLGEVMSYQELAAEAGNPKAARAAGTACATNGLAPFVPCHRVVKSGGALGNYGYGVDIKQSMLDMERRAVAASR